MVFGRLPRESHDDVGTQPQPRKLRGQPFDPGAVAGCGVPVASHALEETVATRLERSVKVRRQPIRSADHEISQPVVDLSGFNRGKPKPHARHRGDQLFA